MRVEYYLALVVSVLVAVASQWIQESAMSTTPSYAKITTPPAIQAITMIQARPVEFAAPSLPSSFLEYPRTNNDR